MQSLRKVGFRASQVPESPAEQPAYPHGQPFTDPPVEMTFQLGCHRKQRVEAASELCHKQLLTGTKVLKLVKDSCF